MKLIKFSHCAYSLQWRHPLHRRQIGLCLLLVPALPFLRQPPQGQHQVRWQRHLTASTIITTVNSIIVYIHSRILWLKRIPCSNTVCITVLLFLKMNNWILHQHQQFALQMVSIFFFTIPPKITEKSQNLANMAKKVLLFLKMNNWILHHHQQFPLQMVSKFFIHLGYGVSSLESKNQLY